MSKEQSGFLDLIATTKTVQHMACYLFVIILQGWTKDSINQSENVFVSAVGN
jgi:hypothetical protein